MRFCSVEPIANHADGCAVPAAEEFLFQVLEATLVLVRALAAVTLVPVRTVVMAILMATLNTRSILPSTTD